MFFGNCAKFDVMKIITLKSFFLFVLSIGSLNLFSQTVPCDGNASFEEQNGLLTIEMESGNLPTGSNWQTEVKQIQTYRAQLLIIFIGMDHNLLTP